MLCQHQTLTFFRAIEEDAFPTFDVLEQRWTEEARAMRDELAGLSDDDLTDYVRYTTPEGEKRERLLWHCAVHTYLVHNAHIPTKRRKQLEANPIAPWELKKDKYRIFYDIIGDTVDILAIGYKDHNDLFPFRSERGFSCDGRPRLTPRIWSRWRGGVQGILIPISRAVAH